MILEENALKKIEDNALPEPVLGVTESLLGHRWVWRTGADDAATRRLGSAIAQSCGLPEIVARVMAMRG